MLASFHPSPSGTLFAAVVFGVAFPPLLLHAYRRRWCISRRLKFAIVAFMVVSSLLLARDVLAGWEWRRTDPYRPPGGYRLPWWYLVGGQEILMYARIAFTGSGLLTLGYAVVSSRRGEGNPIDAGRKR